MGDIYFYSQFSFNRKGAKVKYTQRTQGYTTLFCISLRTLRLHFATLRLKITYFDLCHPY